MQGEEGVVAAVQGGNLGAFSGIYERYFDKVYRYILVRVGNPSDAEDMAGEVFLKALEAIGSYKPRGVPFSAWLFRIAHNLLVDHYRKRTRYETGELDDAVLELPGPRLEDAADLKFAIQDVVSAMSGLTDLQRQVLALRFAAEQSVAETARIMGKKDGAIKSLQHSAIQALRRALAQGGEDRLGSRRQEREGGEDV